MADVATIKVIVDGTSLEEGTRKLKDFENQGAKSEKQAESLGRTMARAGQVIAAAWITRQIIANTIEAQYAVAQLEARIKATEGAAGRTSVQLQAMASALQRVSVFSDEAIMSAQTMLMTFRSLKGEAFDRATKAALDLATAMGTDAAGAALQLGKALEDPETGLTMLRRSGILFTDAQREQIKVMMEAGKVMEAQNLILTEMEKKFGGAALAARDTLGGALQGLKNDFGDMLEVSREASADIILIINVVATLIRKFTELKGVLGSLIPSTPNPALNWLIQRYGGGGGTGGGESQAVADTTYLIPLMDTLSVTVDRTADAAQKLADGWKEVATEAKKAATVMQANPNLWANRGYQTGQDYFHGQLPTPRMYGSFGGGTGATSGVVRGDYASALFGGMGGTGQVLNAAMVGGVQGAAVALTGAIASMVQDMASSAQRAREAARLMRIAVAEFNRALDEAIAAFADNAVESTRVQIQRMLEKWVQMFFPGTDPGTFAAGAKSWEDLLKYLDEMTAAVRANGNGVEEWLKIVEWATALIKRNRNEEAQAAQEAARSTEDVAEAMREYEEAAKAAAKATLALIDDLTERGYRLTGRGGMADTYGLSVRQRTERANAAGQSADVLALMDLVHLMEREELKFNQAVGAIRDGLELQLAELRTQEENATKAWETQDAAFADQIELAEANLRVVEQGFADQIDTAKEALRTAESQLRTQERTVDELRRVVENLAEFRQSLLTSDLSTLSPARQLEVARDAFTALAGQAMGGSASAAAGLPAASRTFLDASRKYNASGVRYQSDWDAVNNVLYTVQGKIAGQLTIEEQMLSALNEQVRQFTHQINVIEDARSQADADAQRQISELQAAREASRAQYESQVAAIHAQMEAIQQAADDQIANMQHEFDLARELWQAQLDELVEQNSLLNRIGTYITDQGGGQLPPEIKPDLDLIVQNTAASVNVLQSGLGTVSSQLEGVREEIGALRSEIRRGMEVAVE